MRQIDVFITSENDGTVRNKVPDWLVHIVVRWIDSAGQTRQAAVDRYLLEQLAWLRTAYPEEARELMHDLVYRIERVRQGIDVAVT